MAGCYKGGEDRRGIKLVIGMEGGPFSGKAALCSALELICRASVSLSPSVAI